VRGAIRSFLERNRDYKSHRELRLKLDAQRRGRPKRTQEKVIAIGCAAIDLEHSGQSFTQLPKLLRDVPALLKKGDIRTHKRRVLRLHELAGLQ
jgi:hypothetical protein